MDKQLARTSKFLSLILRHHPEKVGLKLDEAGWVGVAELLSALAAHGHKLTQQELETVVFTNDKQRFAFSPDGLRIRANQGHSVEVELAYAPAVPPIVLYHGTAPQFLSSIRTQGLLKGQRHHVHLSADTATAQQVGGRRGKPVVLTVQADKMHADGHIFYCSANGVWLTEHVPPQYLVWP